MPTRIEPSTLLKITPDFQKTMTIGSAVNVTRQRFCAKVHSTGLCNGNCEIVCKQYLFDAFDVAMKTKNVRSLVAFLSYQLRKVATELIETSSLKENDKTPTTIHDIFLAGLGVPNES